MLRRLTTAMLVAASFAGLAACGSEHEVKLGETEGIYVTTGDLKYQVQISRVLNPADGEDRTYIAGLEDELDRELGRGQEWFGVFLRVENDTDEPHHSSEEIKIVDTTGAEFRPLHIEARDNPLAYEATEVEPGTTFPAEGSIADESATQGALLLFKIPRGNLENRPLELEIEGEGGPARVDLDV